jgi:carbon-monoxide dehydrogenase iron sulfur subunit
MDGVIDVDHANCTGCRTCEMLCSLYHFGLCSPSKSAIQVIRREKGGLIFSFPLVCQQCDPAPCIESCPVKALTREDNKSHIILNQDECTLCGSCTEACPLGCITVDPEEVQLIHCDLCQGEPQCISACHADCLKLVNRNRRDGKKEIEGMTAVLIKENCLDHILKRRSSS